MTIDLNHVMILVFKLLLYVGFLHTCRVTHSFGDCLLLFHKVAVFGGEEDMSQHRRRNLALEDAIEDTGDRIGTEMTTIKVFKEGKWLESPRPRHNSAILFSDDTHWSQLVAAFMNIDFDDLPEVFGDLD